MALLQFFKVTNYSLSPAYQCGDYVLVSSLPVLLKWIHPGDAIVFQQPGLGRLIKLVERVEAGGQYFYVIGLDPGSVDSRIFGAVSRNQVLGKVVGHFPQKR